MSRSGNGLAWSQDRDLDRLLLEAVRDHGIMMFDLHGHVIRCNPGAGAMTGYPNDEVLGRHLSCFYTEADRRSGRPDEILSRAVSEDHCEAEELRVRKDGSSYWADIVMSPVRDEHGRLRGFAEVARDVTGRVMAEKALRESEERFRLLVAGVRDYAIFMLDPSGNVLSWNCGAELIMGYEADEVLGGHWSCFYSEEDRRLGAPDTHLAEAERQGRVEAEGWCVRKDGSQFWANAVITAPVTRTGRCVDSPRSPGTSPSAGSCSPT